MAADLDPRVKDRLGKLLSNATEEQWIAGVTFPWDGNWDPSNPLMMASLDYEISDTGFWSSLQREDQEKISRDFQVWRLSQMLHGELSALEVCSKLTTLHTSVEAKLSCTYQAADEARHYQVFSRIIRELGEHPFSITPPLGTLIGQVERDNRISILSLGMQILIEGVGVGAFRRISLASNSPFIRTLFSYIMKDEARHFALGRITLSNREQIMDEVPLEELNDFLDTALVLLDDYLQPTEVLTRFGCSLKHAHALIKQSAFAKQFRRTVFGQLAKPLFDLPLNERTSAFKRVAQLSGVNA